MHDKPKTSEEKDKVMNALLKQNETLSKRAGSPAPKGKGKGKDKTKGSRPYVNFCMKFLKKADPPCDGKCGQDHLTQPQINETREKMTEEAKGK